LFRRFLNRFSDNFGQKFEPAVLLVRASAPPAFLDIAALASMLKIAGDRRATGDSLAST
jgi:hypothetical protein